MNQGSYSQEKSGVKRRLLLKSGEIRENQTKSSKFFCSLQKFVFSRPKLRNFFNFLTFWNLVLVWTLNKCRWISKAQLKTECNCSVNGLPCTIKCTLKPLTCTELIMNLTQFLTRSDHLILSTYIRLKIKCQIKHMFMRPDFLIADLWNGLQGLFQEKMLKVNSYLWPDL